MAKLGIATRRVNGITILDLSGNIRMGDDAVALRTEIRGLVQKGERRVLLNMGNVSYIDSSGLGELVAGFVALKRAGGELRLFQLTQHVSELMVITKLLTVFAVLDEEADAVKSFEDFPSAEPTPLATNSSGTE